MDLSQQESDLIRETYAKLLPVVPEVSGIFYQNLFKIAPEMSDLFRDDLSEQGMKFMSAIGVLVSALDDPEAMEGRLKQLAEGHAAFNLSASDFRKMEDALLVTLSQALRQSMTAEAQVAWRSAFQQISERMLLVNAK